MSTLPTEPQLPVHYALPWLSSYLECSKSSTRLISKTILSAIALALEIQNVACDVVYREGNTGAFWGWRLIMILERASHRSIVSNVAKRISLHLLQKMELSLFPLLFSLILAWISSPSASSVPGFLHSGWEVLLPIQRLFSWPRSSRLSIMYAQKPSCWSQELSSSLAWDKNPILVCSYKWEA